MRKLIVSMNITLDGYLSGPQCQLDWHFKRWDREMGALMMQQLSEADTILLGRKTYEVMAQHWPSVVLNLSYPAENIAFAHLMNKHRKIVFTQTLNKPKWNNAELVHSDIFDEIRARKKKKGGNIIIYGSGQLVASLIDTFLIDEYYLWMHPVVLGDGRPLFKTGVQSTEFDLMHTRSFSSGVVLLHYATNHALKTKKEPAKLKALYNK